ncbi:hypothetical protein BpHYR1_001081 [Brachionus plicatilis]|uniref:Uncharacterized protein n=1 Tax=Brachionus plicatilis TaxID=10195 RepID=A0A3M7S5Z6_BRAPC|nr:hypothetical protein BpHYR1_001081 [Brachionus plicatilis]
MCYLDFERVLCAHQDFNLCWLDSIVCLSYLSVWWLELFFDFAEIISALDSKLTFIDTIKFNYLSSQILKSLSTDAPSNKSFPSDMALISKYFETNLLEIAENMDCRKVVQNTFNKMESTIEKLDNGSNDALSKKQSFHIDILNFCKKTLTLQP